jgi:hypothetical protein
MKAMMRVVVLALVLAPAAAAADAFEPKASPILYLNRCTGNCTVRGGFDDARAMTSSIPCAGTVNCQGGGCVCNGGNTGDYIVEEFRNSAGETGAAADIEWNQIVQCVREVYSPYNIQVVDQVPAGGLSHNQGIVAGRPVNIGYSGVGGIAPGTPGCDPRDNVISFTFANIYGGADRITNVCAVVAQETAHAWGLDHAYAFSDGRSACPDPMSYRDECGGQRFFRNDHATCGEFAPRGCSCGGLQNSHARLLNVFGPGTPITRPPSLTVSGITEGQQVSNGVTVLATAAAQRGIFRLELWLNGYKWLTVKGAAFSSVGQPETTYPMTFPTAVPDGVIDVVVKAFDDINVMAEAPPITVTKGAPCVDASTCAKGQTCDGGRCFWEAPTGKIGDTCDYPQFCESGHCIDTSEGMFCSSECVVGVADSCASGYVCNGQAGSTGFCVPQAADEGGCCSVGSDGRVASLLALTILGLVLRRRRR